MIINQAWVLEVQREKNYRKNKTNEGVDKVLRNKERAYLCLWQGLAGRGLGDIAQESYTTLLPFQLYSLLSSSQVKLSSLVSSEK